MTSSFSPALAAILADREDALLDAWMAAQLSAPTMRRDLLDEHELRADSAELLRLLGAAASAGARLDGSTSEGAAVRSFVAEMTRGRAARGFTPVETATFVLSIKEPLFERLRAAVGETELGAELWAATTVIDELALSTTEVHQRARDDIIKRQQQELLELSTPVVKLWDGVLALPLIGTLDSARTQVVMESLLERVVATSSPIAIIDITGVPTVDTLVAQHLLKTVAAARLMGADCIISGIRPQIAQTIVHLGVDLGDVVTKATMADAVALALDRQGFVIARRDQAS